MALALPKLRKDHGQRLDTLLAQVEELEAKRPALALDDPEELAKLDGKLATLKAEIDASELALEEIERREEAEAAAKAAKEREALLVQLRAAHKERARVVGKYLDAADALGLAAADVMEADEAVYRLASQLEGGRTPKSVRRIGDRLGPALFARTPALRPSGMPYAKPHEAEKHGEDLVKIAKHLDEARLGS